MSQFKSSHPKTLHIYITLSYKKHQYNLMFNNMLNNSMIFCLFVRSWNLLLIRHSPGNNCTSTCIVI